MTPTHEEVKNKQCECEGIVLLIPPQAPEASLT